jgi:L-iditol 2-dehydrogenase
MKGLVKFARGRGQIEVREVKEPRAQAGEVKIEVKATGICGSDIHVFHDEIDLPIQTPVVMGHEFCGVIVDLGEGVTGWHVGDRVTSETAFSVCEKCVYCRTGQYHLCKERKGIGFWFDGSFADFIVVPEKRVHRLPENVDFIAGALCEPLACVIHGVIELSQVHSGDTVLVTGVGSIGLLAAQVARSEGGRIILSGISEDVKRFELARAMGFHELVNVQEMDIFQYIEEMTNGGGVDVILECSGAPEAARTGIRAVKKRGVYTQIGLFGKPLEINFEDIAYKELQVSGSFSQRWVAWEMALKLLELKKVETKPLVTDIYSLYEWQAAFNKFEKRQGTKIIFQP